MALNKTFKRLLEIFWIRGFDCYFFAAYGFESDGAGVESEAIEAKEARFVRRVESVADNRVMEHLEVHSNLVSPTCLWFSFNKSGTFIT